LLLKLLLLLLVYKILALLYLDLVIQQLIACGSILVHPTEYRILYEPCSIKTHCRLWLPSWPGIGLHPDASP
jgi:hypothetical protein